MLLSLDDRAGTEFNRSYLCALGAAVLAELILLERLQLTGQNEPTVEVIQPDRLQDTIMDRVLQQIVTDSRPRSLAYWVRQASTSDLKESIVRELCRFEILKAEEKTVWMLFSKQIYPEMDSQPEQDIKRRLEQLLFADNPQADERTLILASLANGANLIEHNFGVLRTARQQQRIDDLVAQNIYGQQVKKLLQTLQHEQFVPLLVMSMIN